MPTATAAVSTQDSSTPTPLKSVTDSTADKNTSNLTVCPTHSRDSSTSACSTATASPNHSPSTTSAVSSGSSPGSHPTSLQPSRKPRAQKASRKDSTFATGKPKSRSKLAIATLSVVDSTTVDTKQEDSHQEHCACEDKPLEGTNAEGEDVHGKYTPEELVVIQQRVRQSLQRQGVVRSDSEDTASIASTSPCSLSLMHSSCTTPSLETVSQGSKLYTETM